MFLFFFNVFVIFLFVFEECIFVNSDFFSCVYSVLSKIKIFECMFKPLQLGSSLTPPLERMTLWDFLYGSEVAKTSTLYPLSSMVPPWVTAPRFLVGNRYAELK